MTWSYNPSLLSTPQGTPKDAVRLLIGDVIQCDPQLQDEEIEYFASLRGSIYGAAAECCRALSARFSRSVDQKGGTNTIMYSQMAIAYARKAVEFDYKATLTGSSGLPYAGGISISDMQMREMNADRVEPVFTRGMMDDSVDGRDVVIKDILGG